MMCSIAVTDDMRREWAQVFMAPLESLKAAAGEADRDERLMARWFSCTEGALMALIAQGDDYLRELAEEIYVKLGPSRRARRLTQLRRVTLARKRMARMYHQQQKRKSA